MDVQIGDLPPSFDFTPVTANYLREGSERSGFPVTGEQFASYVKAGLLPEPDASARYPAWAVYALIAARREAMVCRSIPRRVVRLRANFHLFRVPIPKLRRAIVDMLPSVKASRRKLSELRSALAAAGWNGVLLPQVSELPSLFESFTDDQFEARTVYWYRTIVWLPDRLAPKRHPFFDLPFEEQLVLFAAVDIATLRATRPIY